MREDPDTFRKWLPFLAVLATGVVVAFLLMAVFVVVAVKIGMNRSAESKQARKLPTREELRQELTGKSQKEILERLGRPVRPASEYPWGSTWNYTNWRGFCYDPATGLMDEDLSVHFDENGKVTRLSF